MSATPTPRTDAAAWWDGPGHSVDDEVVPATLSRKLETELAQLRASNEYLSEQVRIRTREMQEDLKVIAQLRTDVRPLVEAWNGISNDCPTPPALSQAFTAFLAGHPEFNEKRAK